MAAYSGFGAPNSGPGSRPRSRTEDFPMSDRGQNTTNTQQSLAQPEGESSTWSESITSRLHIPQGIKNLWNNKGGQEKDGTGVDQQGSNNGQVAMVPSSRGAVTSQPKGNARDIPDDWEDVELPMEDVLKQALEELEDLRRKQASNLIKISDLEQQAVVAEASAQSKEGAIAKLVKQIQELELPEHKGMTQSDDSEDRKLVIKIDDLQASEEQLRKECEEKEQQRFEATQQVITLREELRVLGSKSDQNEALYNQAMEENKDLKEKVAELNKLMDAGPTTYIDGEEPSDDEQKTLISQLQGRIKMLEKEVAQLKPFVENSKKQSREIHMLKQEKEGMEMQEGELESFKEMYHELEGQMQGICDRLKARDEEVDGLKDQIHLMEEQAKDARDHGTQLKSQHDELKVKFQHLTMQYDDQLEQHKLAINSMNKVTFENDDLCEQLTKMEAEKQSIVGELEATKVEVMVYKGDFDEERKDRMAAHSKFADLEKEMVEHKNNFHASLKIATDELEQHKRSLEDVENVKVQLENELREVQENLEQWRSEALQSREDVQAKTSQVKAYKKQVDQLKLEVETKAKQLEGATGSLGVLSEELDGQRKAAAKKSKNKDKKKSATAEVGPVEGLERKLAKAEERCDQLQTQSENWQRRHDELKTKYKGLKSDVDHLKLDNQSLRAEIEELNDKMMALQTNSDGFKKILKAEQNPFSTQSAIRNAVDKGYQKTGKEEHGACGTGNFDQPLRASDPRLNSPTDLPSDVGPSPQYVPSDQFPGSSNIPGSQRDQGIPSPFPTDHINASPYPAQNQLSMHRQGDEPQNAYDEQSAHYQDQHSGQALSRGQASQFVHPEGAGFSNEGGYPSGNFRQYPEQSPTDPNAGMPSLEYRQQQGNISNQPSSFQTRNNFDTQRQAISEQVVAEPGSNVLVVGEQQYQPSQYTPNLMPATYPQVAQSNQQYYPQGNQTQFATGQQMGIRYPPSIANQQRQWAVPNLVDQYGNPININPPQPRPRNFVPVQFQDGGQTYQRQSSNNSMGTPSGSNTPSTPVNPAYENYTPRGAGSSDHPPQQVPPQPAARTTVPLKQDPPQTGQYVGQFESQPSLEEYGQEEPSVGHKVAKDTRMLVQPSNLQDNIDTDMKDAVARVTAENSSNSEAPYDPNLICPMCMKNYRIGEIQFFRAHVNKCDGTAS